jgi:HEAT repeat protein
MKRARLLLAVVALLLVAAGAAALLDPAARVAGWVRGEPFYRDRSASAWRRDLAQPDANARSKTTDELAEGKADAVPVLAAILGSGGDAEARWRAADALGRLGADARGAGPELIRALDDPDPHVKTIAAQTLEKLAPHVPEAVSALIKAFPRVEAIRAVCRYGEKAAEAVPPLVGLLKNSDPPVRWNAARALGKLQETAKSAIPDLVAAMGDPDKDVREHAAEALGDIGPAAADSVPALVKVLADPEPMVRRDAVRALGQMGPAAKAALAAVQERKKDENEKVRVAAEDAERKIDPSLAGKKKPDGKKESDPDD